MSLLGCSGAAWNLSWQDTRLGRIYEHEGCANERTMGSLRCVCWMSVTMSRLRLFICLISTVVSSA